MPFPRTGLSGSAAAEDEPRRGTRQGSLHRFFTTNLVAGGDRTAFTIRVTQLTIITARSPEGHHSAKIVSWSLQSSHHTSSSDTRLRKML